VIRIPCPHFKISIVKRSQGQSAVAGAAYQSGERLFSEYDQKTKFYNKKKELVHAEIMLPPHVPPGYADRATLWNAVEAVENQWNSQLARRIVLALPREVPKDKYIRLINSHYDDLYRIPDGGVVQVDYPDGRSFTARLEHLDDYHFDMGGLGNVFHICQFAEVMERNHADFYPEIQTQDEQAAWELGGKGYLAIQSCEDGWDYTLYHSDYSVMDGGQLGAPELTIQEAREQILEAHHMEKGRRLLQDYDAVMDKVAEAEELSADHRPSTLEKLAELASDTSAPKSSERSAPEL
jgi:hypothetical protein